MRRSQGIRVFSLRARGPQDDRAKVRRIQFLRLACATAAFFAGVWLPLRLLGLVPILALEAVFYLIISFVSLSHIYLHFKTNTVNPRKIRSWLDLSLLLDVFCALPFSLVALAFTGETFDGFLILNLTAVRHIRHVRPFLDRFHSLPPVAYRLVPLMVALPLLVHITACGWIALGSGTAELGDPMLTYVRAVYWTITTFTTVGYGDIAARSISQMLYAGMAQIMGVGIFGFIISNVAGILARSDAAREHHMDNLDKIETFMRLHRINPELRTKIREYYHYMWVNKKGYRDDALLEGLPGKIQSELFLHINLPIIEKVPFLRGADPELIEELMSELKPRIFIPGEKIFRADEPGDALYIIQSGEVEILARDDSPIAILGEGAFFGEMALLSNSARTATARARTYCDLYCLRRESFERVMELHPVFRHHIEEVMQARRAA
jgi:voltage-gated potassium channel